MLKQSIDSVNQTQLQANEMKQSFELGQNEVNLAEVMVAVQKSSVSFEAMVQVRNKLVDAYKEVMNMPI
jgi:flagellar hook-basal body complex protein FliE